MKVELHVIQNFAPSCLNRDDVNAPKDCEFGGYRRARISSQCLKRAVRKYWDEHQLLAENRAYRTKLVVHKVVERLAARGKPIDEARRAVEAALAGVAKVHTDKAGATEYLLFLGRPALDAFTEATLKHWGVLTAAADAISAKTAAEEAKTAAEEAKTAAEQAKADAAARQTKRKEAVNLPDEVAEELGCLFDGKGAADLALFGRMIADSPGRNIEAACQVAHAISTHRVSMEVDYFTAVDDLRLKEEPGAGMIGTIEFNSACFYRYSLLDFVQLTENLGGDAELAGRAASAFIIAAIEAIPSGKQASMAAYNPPSFALTVVRDGGMPWSLANAFENPIYPTRASDGGLVAKSIQRLDDYWGRLARCYGNGGLRARGVLSLEDLALPNIGDEHRVKDLQALVAGVAAALGGAR